MSDVLLPSSSTAQERAIEAATARIGELDTTPITSQWNPDTCPAELLPWLAWALSVDEWSASWPDEFKRRSIADSIDIHRRKGTLSSIRRVIENAGYGDSTIVEGVYGAVHDGTFTHDGTITYGDETEWAKYRIILTRPMTNAQAAQVRRILGFTAPARSKLEEIIYTAANNIYNGAIFCDGTFNHGTA